MVLPPTHGNEMQTVKAILSRALPGILLLSLCAAGCGFSGTDRMKKTLERHGSIEAEWEIVEEGKPRYTYVMLRTPKNIHETYEIIAPGGKAEVTYEHVGGIDGTGCYLTAAGRNTQWIMRLDPEALKDAVPRGDKMRTPCLEYKGTQGWRFIPEKDRLVAEPPPPKPEPKPPAPDAGTTDPSAPTTPTEPEDKGDVKSAMPM